MIIDSGIATGSLAVSGPLSVTGSTTISGSITLNGDTVISGSLNVTGGVTGSFTGSFSGDGSNLTGLASSASFAAVSSSFVAVSSSYSAASGSLSIRVTDLESTASTLTTTSASFAVVSASYSSASGSLSIRTTNLESTASTLTTASASFALVSSSYSAASGSLSMRTTNLESTASTLTTASASFASNIKNLQDTESILINASASFSTRTTNLESTASVLTTASASFALVSGSYSLASGSLSTRTTNLESTASSLTTASSSFSTRVTVIEGSYATTGSNTFTGTQYVSNGTNPTTFTSTAALYTDGGLRVTKDAFISGGLSIAGNLTVFGTASVSYVTTSVFVGLNFIDLNTQVPAIRYAGINVGDSGSAAGISSSFWYDSDKDNWIFVYAAPTSAQTSSLAINGPIAYNNVGNEQGLTANYITKAQLVTPGNNHHITSSQIYDDGTTVRIAGNLQVTGSIYAANLTGSLSGSNLVDGTVGNAKLQNSTISGIALGSNLATLTIGTGLSGTSYNGSTGVTIANTGVTSFNTRTGAVTLAATDVSGLAAGIFSGSAQIPATSITNAQLVNSSVTVTAGTGMSGGGAVALGSSVTLTNAGVTSAVAGTAISVSGATGAVTINNTGVTSNVAGTGVSVSGATGAVTISIGQAVATSSNVQFNSLGVGTAGSAVAGEIRATADITAYYASDERLKENITRIEDPIAKIKAIDGVTFSWKEGFDEVHTHKGDDTGVIAQQIEAIGLPDTVTTRENGYKAVRYEKLNALLIEGMKAQQAQIDFLQQQLEELKAILNK